MMVWILAVILGLGLGSVQAEGEAAATTTAATEETTPAATESATPPAAVATEETPAAAPALAEPIDITAFVNRKDVLNNYTNICVQELLNEFGITPHDDLFIILRPNTTIAHLIRVKGSLWRDIHCYTQPSKRGNYTWGLLGTAAQILAHEHVAANPLPEKIVAVLNAPADLTNYEWDRTREIASDGSYLLHEMGNLIGWMKEIPGTVFTEDVMKGALTAEVLGITEAIANSKAKLGMESDYFIGGGFKGHFSLLIGVGVGEDGVEYHTASLGRVFHIKENIKKAFIGIGPDIHHVRESTHRKPSSSLLWYTAPEDAAKAYLEGMPLTTRNQRMTYDASTLEAKLFKKRKEKEQGVIRKRYRFFDRRKDVYYTLKDNVVVSCISSTRPNETNAEKLFDFSQAKSGKYSFRADAQISAANLGITLPAGIDETKCSLLVLEETNNKKQREDILVIDHGTDVSSLGMREGRMVDKLYYGYGDEFENWLKKEEGSRSRGDYDESFGYNLYKTRKSKLERAYAAYQEWIDAGKNKMPRSGLTIQSYIEEHSNGIFRSKHTKFSNNGKKYDVFTRGSIEPEKVDGFFIPLFWKHVRRVSSKADDLGIEKLIPEGINRAKCKLLYAHPSSGPQALREPQFVPDGKELPWYKVGNKTKPGQPVAYGYGPDFEAYLIKKTSGTNEWEPSAITKLYKGVGTNNTGNGWQNLDDVKAGFAWITKWNATGRPKPGPKKKSKKWHQKVFSDPAKKVGSFFKNLFS